MYMDPTYFLKGKGFQQFFSLKDDNSTYIDQDWALNYNIKENHLLFHVGIVSQMAIMHSCAFFGTWEDANKIKR